MSCHSLWLAEFLLKDQLLTFWGFPHMLIVAFPLLLLKLFLCIYLFKIYLFIYLFIYGCVGSSLLCEGFLQLWQVEATLHRGARASHYHGLSFRGAQAPDTQAQQLWLTGPAAPQHVGSSQTRARTRVPCIGRRTLNHCATREALYLFFDSLISMCLGMILLGFVLYGTLCTSST